MNRRIFIKASALGFFTLHFSPFSRALAAMTPAKKGKVLVVIFQRGACDGLTFLPPIAEPDYFAYRPHIAIQPKGEGAAIPLDGHFGMHPSLIALKPFWDNGTLAFVHQCGSPDTTRSHFDAQDYMESGTPGVKITDDGYLNRAMRRLAPSKESRLRAIALEANMPRSLQGPFPAISMNSIQAYGLHGQFAQPQVLNGFESMYQQATDHVLRGVGDEVFESLKTLKSADPEDARNDAYPKGNPLANHLKEIAALIKADIGMQVAATDCGGWDTHVNQGADKGRLSTNLKGFGEAIAAFARDLGPRFNDVCLVTMTEFGRTARENGNRGTDHGHGSVMSILGGPVRGKNVFARWKSITPANLNEGRDLPVTTDFREVLTTILVNHLGVPRDADVFPKFTLPSQTHSLLRV